MSVSRQELIELLEFAQTPTQVRAIERSIECGSMYAAAMADGKCKTFYRNPIRRVKTYATTRGWSPEHGWTKKVPEGYKVKGTSTLYDDEGRQKIQWVKTDIDKEKQIELMNEVLKGFKDELPVYSHSVDHSDDQSDPDLMNCYIITDYHLGMLAWHEESGDDWDLSIAEATLREWFKSAIAQSPTANRACLVNLGDYLHYDSMESVTPTSRHQLDSDSRYQKVVRVAIRLMRWIIDELLTKYKRVDVIIATGNHDLSGSVWLREAFAHVYSGVARVHIDRNPDVYYCVEHGETVLFFHHGHKRKVSEVSKVFASKYKRQFGLSQHAYAHTGHLHHDEKKEDQLMTVEQHRTLAAKDAHASLGGYMSGRDSKVITYHKKFGEVGRVTISYDAIKNKISV